MWHSHERSKTATFWEYLQQINDSNDVQIVKKSEGGNHMPWLAEEFGMFGSNMRCFVEKNNSWNLLEVWILLTVLSRKTSAYFFPMGQEWFEDGLAQNAATLNCHILLQPRGAVPMKNSSL